jgi:hypothetical protein
MAENSRMLNGTYCRGGDLVGPWCGRPGPEAGTLRIGNGTAACIDALGEASGWTPNSAGELAYDYFMAHWPPRQLVSQGRHFPPALSLGGIDCYLFGVYTIVWLSLLSCSTRMTVPLWTIIILSPQVALSNFGVLRIFVEAAALGWGVAFERATGVST